MKTGHACHERVDRQGGASLESGGVNFHWYSYVPEEDPLSGRLLVTHEDDPHKLKLLVNHIRAQLVGSQPQAQLAGSLQQAGPQQQQGHKVTTGQRRSAAALAGQAGSGAAAKGLLISKARILEASTTDPKLGHFPQLLPSSADDQSTAISEALFWNKDLWAAQLKLGYERDAMALEVIGEGHAAWDMSGFTPEQRTQRLERVARLLCTVFAERLSLAAEAGGGALYGFPRDLPLSILGNAEGRRQLLHRFPFLKGVLVERSFLTNDLETEFSTIVRRCGYKPVLRVLLGALQSVDIQATVRRDPNVNLSLPASAKVSYNQQQQQAANDAGWHDSSSARRSGTQWRRHLAAIDRAALRSTGQQAVVRDYHR